MIRNTYSSFSFFTSINCGKISTEWNVLCIGSIYNLYLISYTRRWELAGEILNQIDWDWRLFTKVNGKDVLKEAIAAGGVSDLARITGVEWIIQWSSSDYLVLVILRR